LLLGGQLSERLIHAETRLGAKAWPWIVKQLVVLFIKMSVVVAIHFLNADLLSTTTATYYTSKLFKTLVSLNPLQSAAKSR